MYVVIHTCLSCVSHVWRPEGELGDMFRHSLPIFSQASPLSEPGQKLIRESPSNLPVSTLGIQMHSLSSAFHGVAGPHACTVCFLAHWAISAVLVNIYCNQKIQRYGCFNFILNFQPHPFSCYSLDIQRILKKNKKKIISQEHCLNLTPCTVNPKQSFLSQHNDK